MIQIQFGDRYIEFEGTLKSEVEDLASSPSNEFLLSILATRMAEASVNVRTEIRNGDLGKAQISEGYATAIEDVINLLERNLKEGLKLVK